MSKNRYHGLYDKARESIYSKDKAIQNFIANSLDKTLSMFVYSNLPDSIPPKELERLLQLKGKCIVAEVDGKLYAFKGGFSGETDVYENPTQFTVSNVALNLSKTFTIDEDCVLFKNDFSMQGLLPIFDKYGTLICDTEMSMNMASILLRIPMLISAPDDKTKESAELFLKRLNAGDFGIIGETPFFDGIKTHTNTNNYSAYLTGFVELMQYFKGSFCNEIGLNANFNMKREHLTESEVLLNIDLLAPLIDEMYSERVTAIEKVNKMFGTEIIVDYNSVWKSTHEEVEKETETEETIILDELEENATNGGERVDETETVEDESTEDESTEDESTEDESTEDESTEDESTEDESTEDESTADESDEDEDEDESDEDEDKDESDEDEDEDKKKRGEKA